MLPADQAMFERLGARLRELRTAAKLTQDQVGERAGFSGKYVGEIEKGVRDVPLSTLRAVVENGLGMALSAVFTGRSRRLDATPPTHARDVDLTASMIAGLPLRVRRPMLALAREIAELEIVAVAQTTAEPSSKAAEHRRKRG